MRRVSSPQASLAFTLTAVIFYFPANLFPFMTMEFYGNRTSSTIWSGVVQLTQQKSYFIAGVVFLASILIPVIKLLILLYLTLSSSRANRSFKLKLYRFVEVIGRWSMLDIFLLAILVAVVKLGHFATVRAEKGAALFAALVIFTMLASATFDPNPLGESVEK